MKNTTNTNERASSHGVVADTAELIALRHAAVGLQLGVPRRIASSLAGPYLSRIRGRGLDFEEVRLGAHIFSITAQILCAKAHISSFLAP